MSDRQHFVVTAPDGREHFTDVYRAGVRPWQGDTGHKKAAEDAVLAFKMTSSRKHPEAVVFDVQEIVLASGRVMRRMTTKVSVTPPRTKMTSEEYVVEMRAIWEKLPPPFANWVSDEAYAQGHSAGYEEVVSIAENMTAGLQTAVEKYALTHNPLKFKRD